MRAHFRYQSYVLRHKWFVLLAGLKTGAPMWRLLIHDWSKFSPTEWWPYALTFYGPWKYADRPPAVVEAIARAWLHHQHAHPHHWQHWIFREDGGAVKRLEIPEHFVREMVADWMGAGRAITGKWDALGWYLRSRDNIALHNHTEALVNCLLAVPPHLCPSSPPTKPLETC